jgi:hypothetical protein
MAMKTPNQLVFSAYHSRLAYLKNQLDPFLAACNGINVVHGRKLEDIIQDIRQIAQQILDERGLFGTARSAEAGSQGKISVTLEPEPGLPSDYLLNCHGETELRWFPDRGFLFDQDTQLLQ